MEQNAYHQNALDMIYLTACAINGTPPAQERVASMDLPQLFEVCQGHVLTACAAYALEAAGVTDHEFTQAKEKAIRKNILLDTERKKILSRMEEEQIWYMPLKGALLKEHYPRLGMRQMSDNDILCDPAARERIRGIMAERGFTLKLIRPYVDEYAKPPVFNFEMHECFFSEKVGPGHQFYEYYRNVKDRLIKDEDNGYGYHFSHEDFYLYMLAHEYKHYSDGGTGVRSLVDSCIFLRKFGDTLDWDYIRGELARTGLTAYEESSRTLAAKVFGLEPLTEAEQKELDYYIFSGTYGTLENSINNKINEAGKGSKSRYLLYRIFPPYDYLCVAVPWVKKSKLLIPAAYVFRLFRGAGDRNTQKEIGILHKK